ncbi:MAG: hypothetical protein EBZ63_05730, partial [Burkholderiaceae bacterium]|nr:hypothetical protein [Burkholderiaceae bacterium]
MTSVDLVAHFNNFMLEIGLISLMGKNFLTNLFKLRPHPWVASSKSCSRNGLMFPHPGSVITLTQLITSKGVKAGHQKSCGSIVFLYDALPTDYAAQEIYSVLGKRMINWLTTLTAAGTLFEIDTRLRPNGAAGFLVTSLDSFRRYQLREGDNAAWVWEHQA